MSVQSSLGEGADPSNSTLERGDPMLTKLLSTKTKISFQTMYSNSSFRFRRFCIRHAIVNVRRTVLRLNLIAGTKVY
jgi:hypothetical protein